MAVLFCMLVIATVPLCLVLFVPRHFIFWCLRKAVLCDCGLSYVTLFIFLERISETSSMFGCEINPL